MSWDDREKIKLEERTLQVGLSKDWENGENKGSREPRRPLHDSICHWCHPHNFPRRLYFTALSRFPLRVAILYFFSLWQTNCHALPVLFSSVAMATSPDLGLLQSCMFLSTCQGFHVPFRAWIALSATKGWRCWLSVSHLGFTRRKQLLNSCTL